VLLRSKRKGIDVDTSVGGAGVVLEGLNDVEVRTLSLGDAVLAVKLELSGDDGVLTPAVEVEGSLSEDEGAGIGDGRAGGISTTGVEDAGSVPVLGRGGIVSGDEAVNSTGHLEDTSRDEGVGTRGLSGAAEGMDGGRESINGIGVVEGLGTEDLEESTVALEGGAVIDVGIGLDDPDELLARVVEVDLDLVTGRSDRLVTGVLELLDEVLVGVLGHLSALIGIQEDEINVDRGSNKGLLVGAGDSLRSTGGDVSQRLDSPQALTNRSEIDVNLDLVVLESNQRKSKTRVSAKPEEERDVESGLRKGLAGSANLSGSTNSGAGAVDLSEGGISDVGELSGVANHLVVTSLLLRRESELIPDVHPVTILTIDSLTADLDLDLSNELLAGVVQPTGIDTGARGSQALVNLGESNLNVGAVGKISVSGDGAGHTATKVSLTVEGLLDGLHGEVGVASVRHLPESNLGVSSKENILSAVGD
jgi:hypothetical protein